MKHFTFILCAMMTCIIIAASLFLPQLGFALLDEKKQQDIFTEQADAVTTAEDLTQSDKLLVIAQSLGYRESAPVRTSGFFLKTGDELAEKDLLQVIKRELGLFDPSDSLGVFAALKSSDDKPELTAGLENLVQYNETPMSFPVWRVDVKAGGMVYQFMLDAVSGKIYSIYSYLTDLAYESGEDGDTVLSANGAEIQPPKLEPELLDSFGQYLGYSGGPATWMEAGYGLSVSMYVYPADGQKFVLSYFSSGYNLSLSPLFLDYYYT